MICVMECGPLTPPKNPKLSIDKQPYRLGRVSVLSYDVLSLRSTSSPADDFVFEDFARLGLTGMKDEGDPFC